MYELFPLLAGAATALSVHRFAPPRLRLSSLIALSVALGFVASFISGEVFESLLFLLIDTALVLLAAAVTWGLLAWWERRPQRPV